MKTVLSEDNVEELSLLYTMKQIIALAALGIITSCSSRDKICQCIEAGKKLDEKSSAFFKNNASGNAGELKKLREEKDQICKEFENMDGPEMKKRMETCE